MVTATNHLASSRRPLKEVDRVPVRRAVAVMALIGVAVIHLMDAPDKFEEVPYIGVLFVALIVASLLLAEVLIRHDDLRAWVAAGRTRRGHHRRLRVESFGRPARGGRRKRSATGKRHSGSPRCWSRVCSCGWRSPG